MFKFKNQKVNFYYTVPYITRINQIFEIFGMYGFAFTDLAIEKTFTQLNFLPSKIKIVSMYFPMKI